ncbi:MAG: SHOCT domain-containing protein [Nocardioides sp.]
MWNDDYGHWRMMDAGIVWFMLLLLVVIAAAVITLLAVLFRDPPRAGRDDSGRQDSADIAVGILRERLARGELDESEYESRLRALKGS